MTAGELAGILGLELRGDAARGITGAASLEAATPGDVVFAGAPKFFAAAQGSNAGCVIALPAYDAGTSQTFLVSPAPRAHFAHALRVLYPAPPLTPGIHASAVVDATAMVDVTAEIGPHVVIAAGVRVGANVRIEAGCSIGINAVIGDGSSLAPRVTIYHGVRIGQRCRVHAGAVIGADGFGFEFQAGRFEKVPQVGIVVVGDDVEIGANTCIDRAALGVTEIGDGTKLDNMVHIAHNCRIGKHVVIAAQTGFAGGVTVGDYAVVGGQVGVGDKARIESRAVIGSGAGILTSKIVRAGEPVWGTPARPLRQYLAQLAQLSSLARRKNKSN